MPNGRVYKYPRCKWGYSVQTERHAQMERDRVGYY